MKKLFLSKTSIRMKCWGFCFFWHPRRLQRDSVINRTGFDQLGLLSPSKLPTKNASTSRTVVDTVWATEMSYPKLTIVFLSCRIYATHTLTCNSNFMISEEICTMIGLRSPGAIDLGKTWHWWHRNDSDLSKSESKSIKLALHEPGSICAVEGLTVAEFSIWNP